MKTNKSTSRIFRAYIVPAAVFQSVGIAGGYGTGRETVEYFSRFGAHGGLLGILATIVMLGIVAGVAFEFARQFKAYDYRSYFKALIGPFWFLFEVLYLLMFILVLGVIGSAAGVILSEQFAIAESLGLAIMLGSISILIFFGREAVARVLTYWSFVFFAVLAAFVFEIMSESGAVIAEQLREGGIEPGWFAASATYSLYTSSLLIAVLFATRGITTRREAFGAGMLASFVCHVPAILFHLIFLSDYSRILAAPVPIFALLSGANAPFLLAAYTVVLFGTFIETGAGFIQTVNERIDHWWAERGNLEVPRWAHASFALIALLTALAFGQLGIVTLVAKGYGTIAWGFLLVFVLPIMTVGVYRVFGARRDTNQER